MRIKQNKNVPIKKPRTLITVGYIAMKRTKIKKLKNSRLLKKELSLFLSSSERFFLDRRLRIIVYIPKAIINIPIIVGKKLGPVSTFPPE